MISPIRKKSSHMSLTGRDKKFIEISKCSRDFQNIYERYKLTQPKNIILPNIITLIQDYRTEKLNALTDSEIVKEEIGGEVRKIKENVILSRHYDPNKPQKEVRVKENRNSLLVTLNKFEKQGKFNLINLLKERTRKRLKKEKEFNLNILYQGGYYKNDIKKQLRQKKRNTIRCNTEELNVHDKIDILADDIEYDSKMLKSTYKKTFMNFQNEFNDWKQTQEFIYPDIKQKKY